MKKTVLILLAAMLATQLAFAQKGGWDFQLGIGSGLRDHSSGHAEIVYRSNDNEHSQSSPIILPTVLFSGGYNLERVPVGIFLDLGWNHAWNKLEGGPEVLREKEVILHAMPNVRLYYLRRDAFRMYATLGLDMRYRHFSENYAGSSCSNRDINIGYQLSPLGFSFGDRWYFSLDLGYGSIWSLAKVGVGYRF